MEQNFQISLIRLIQLNINTTAIKDSVINGINTDTIAVIPIDII